MDQRMELPGVLAAAGLMVAQEGMPRQRAKEILEERGQQVAVAAVVALQQLAVREGLILEEMGGRERHLASQVLA